MKKKCVLYFFSVLVVFSFKISTQTSPDKFLGHRIGEDRKLADYNQILTYFQKLDQESGKIKLIKIGKTTLNKPMIMAIITSEENMARLDTYRKISKRLRDARGLTIKEAKRLAKEGKVIVLITCSLHATEIAASQMSMELAYQLVTGETDFNTNRILNDVIVLLAPTINPDGHQMVTEWYRKNVGTVYEGSRMPWLYHHYAGHDNNRDWFMFNLSETRAVTKVLYHDWIPQVHIDEHQMGSTGARLFLPPFMDPPVPNIHPLVWRGIALCGINMAYDLQKNGYSGVVYSRSFTGWWIGACDDTSWLHNSIGLLSEMASVKIATPIYIDPTELPKSYIERRIQFPDPWPGGWWRLRDLIDYELIFSKSLLKTAFLHKEDFLLNFYKMCKESIDQASKGKPFAFIIPKIQHDYPTALRMFKILMFGGIEIHQSMEDTLADGKLYPAGSFVVLMSQPYRPYAQTLLERQKYPDLRQSTDDSPIPPYDNAGWTLPLQMGVSCDRIEKPFKTTALKKLGEVPYPKISLPKETNSYLILDSRNNASFSVVFSLLQKNAEIYRSRDCIRNNGFSASAGSFIIKNTPQVQKNISALLEKSHLNVYELKNITQIAKAPLKRYRVGLYQSWRASMDEGWTRYVFDDLNIPYTTLHNKDFKGMKKKRVNLRKKFDVIVFADESPEIIKSGKPDPTSRRARRFTDLPAPFKGGIGTEGIRALRNFVADGGILVAMNNATRLMLKEFKVPVRNILEKVNRNKFLCPTSLLKIKVNNKVPIGYGMPEKAAVMFSRSPAFRTWLPSGDWDRSVVASYPKENILLSGWLLGEDIIARRSALVDVTYKKGHIILIGFRCQHRAQSHGTYKFLLNALLYPEI